MDEPDFPAALDRSDTKGLPRNGFARFSGFVYTPIKYKPLKIKVNQAGFIVGLKWDGISTLLTHPLLCRWALVMMVFLTACAVDKPVRQNAGSQDDPFSDETGFTPSKQIQKTANRYRNLVLKEARSQLGRPYRWGGKSPRNGFDCSGLVFFTHRKAGLQVPRMSASQLSEANKVSLHKIQPGDLVFFRIRANASHVGIYIGGGEFIHAPSRGRRVSKESLKNGYWYRHLVAAGNFYR